MFFKDLPQCRDLMNIINNCVVTEDVCLNFSEATPTIGRIIGQNHVVPLRVWGPFLLDVLDSKSYLDELNIYLNTRRQRTRHCFKHWLQWMATKSTDVLHTLYRFYRRQWRKVVFHLLLWCPNYCCSSGSAEVGAELSGQRLSMSTHVLQHSQPISSDTFGPLVSLQSSLMHTTKCDTMNVFKQRLTKLCAFIPVCVIHDQGGRGGGVEAIMAGLLAALECSHSEQV